MVASKTGPVMMAEWAASMPSPLHYTPDRVWKRLRLKAKQTRHHSPAAASSVRKENWRTAPRWLRGRAFRGGAPGQRLHGPVLVRNAGGVTTCWFSGMRKKLNDMQTRGMITFWEKYHASDVEDE